MKNYTIDAYNREMALIPIVIEMEKIGVRVRPDIEEFHNKWEAKFEYGEQILKKFSDGIEPGTKAFFNMLTKKGLIDKDKLVYTAKGNPRYGREFLPIIINNDELRSILETRSRLQKALGTYIRPFLHSYTEYTGWHHPYYNQTRNEEDTGTRTGRFSSNLQQLPRNPPEGADLPNLRSLVVPDDEDSIIIKRDFNGQELRVTAHYAEGNILKAYQDDPYLDVHNFVAEIILLKTGMDLGRVVVKTINFLKLYGGGAAKLAGMLNISEDKAYAFFKAYDAALPEFKQLMKDIEKMSRSGQKIRTWGGRLYDVEPAKVVDGRRREFYYKLGNVLIQGSSADMTKEAMIRYYNSPNRKGRMILVVHDEIVVSVPKRFYKEEMETLRWAMDDIPGWDVPLRSEGKIGPNFGEMSKYEEERR